MTKEELLVQLALGMVDNSEVCHELYHTTDREIFETAANSPDARIRKSIAVNYNLPYSIMKNFFLNDPDIIVRECAWEHVRRRYWERFNLPAPTLAERFLTGSTFQNLI